MEVRYYGKTPAISDITVYTIIAGDEPGADGNEKILLFPQNQPDDPLALGNLRVHIEPKARGNPRISGKLEHIMRPLVSQVVIPLVAHSLEEKIMADSAIIDPSETAFLVVPSGGQHNLRTFHLKIACVIPIAFLPAFLGLSLNQSKELHWLKMSKILEGYRLDGGEDEEYLTKTVLRAYLRS
ncbi:MAG: hypothetical protein NTX14_00735 [Candidatus Nealsonbacteria bacterium]|nr:hypothetical protein [Candidatus Nealsonbacteria bacterium]